MESLGNTIPIHNTSIKNEKEIHMKPWINYIPQTKQVEMWMKIKREEKRKAFHHGNCY